MKGCACRKEKKHSFRSNGHQHCCGRNPLVNHRGFYLARCNLHNRLCVLPPTAFYLVFRRTFQKKNRIFPKPCRYTFLICTKKAVTLVNKASHGLFMQQFLGRVFLLVFITFCILFYM